MAWLLGGRGAPSLRHHISFTRSRFVARTRPARLLTEAGRSSFAWSQVSVALTWGWAGQPLQGGQFRQVLATRSERYPTQ